MRGLLGVALLSVGAKALVNSAGFTIDPNYVAPNSKVYPPLGANWPTTAPVSGSTYDYIVVGSGPGGGPVAARLALAGHSVLLIDAGEDHTMDRQVQVPALHPFASAYNPIRWSYFVSHYDDPVQAARDSKMTYLTPAGQWYTGLYPPRGSKMLGINYPRTGALGGCAAHNAMITVYPYRNDWDYIANLTGDDSWGADNMRTYFEKLERCEYLPNSVVGHGFTGWLPTQVTPPILIAEDLKVASLLLAACRTIGKTFLTGLVTTVTGLVEVLTQDINSGLPGRDRGEEIYQIPLAMDGINYSRASPRDFVVAVAGARKADGTRRYKLDIALNTLVTRVTFDKAGSGGAPRANGVDYLFGRSMYRADTRAGGVPNGVAGHVRAAKEVIVSAGSFNTPQLLKLSGVGPAAELARFHIPLVHDLPGVGGNLQDRYEIAVVTQADSQLALLKPCKFVAAGQDDPCFDQWNTLPGPLKGAYATNGIAFGYLHHSSQAQGPNDDPDLYLGGVPAHFPGYYPEYATEAVKGLDKWTWFALKARSRNNAGSVNLTSADPRDMPAVHFRSFAQGGEQDLQALVEGLQWGFRALDNVIPLDGTFKRIWPPLNVSTDDELRQFARDESWGHHASCTCPIGADDDPMAVLDSEFRVRGVSGLRVVDASVFPKIPGTYIALPIYMISEKLADVLGA